MLWISGVLALGLFFWQLVMTNLQAGRGFVRLVSGPVQYGVSLAVTVGLVAGFLSGVDGLTNGILKYGLRSSNFTDAFGHTNIGDALGHGVKAAVLGLCAMAGVLPSAIGYVLEMLFREAAIYVLIATVPLVAAGLVANVTARWFWRTVRWLAAAIAMKPVLAMTLVLGVAIGGGSQGVAGLLAGVGVLEISLVAPFALFRLFAFVDPTSDAGGALRDFMSGMGVDSYGSNNPVAAMVGRIDGGDMESVNTSRFDQALTEQSDEAGSVPEIGHSGQPNEGPAGPTGDSTSPQTATAAAPAAGEEGEDPPPPDDPGSTGPKGGGGPHDGGPSGGAAAGGAAEAAVIV
jgi:hypothetical protein